MHNIDIFKPPIENYVIWSGGYTPEECDEIIQFGELEEFKEASVGGGRGISGVTDNKIRNTKIVWIQPRDESKWIFERMNALVGRINFDKFQLQLDKFDGFQYSKYEIGGHYAWHTDTTNDPVVPNQYRKLSFSLLLSSPEEYEGGDLLINHNGNQEDAVLIKPKKGDFVAFYAHLPHKVAPVTSGTRLSLVTWALGDKLV